MKPAPPPSLTPLRRTHWGAYARIVQEGHLLLIQKCRGPYTGMWDLPGGTIEFGETPAEAVLREVEEETGLKAAVDDLMAAPSARLRFLEAGQEVELHHLGVLFNCGIRGGGAFRAEGDGLDASGARWFSPEELAHTPLTPFARVAAGLEPASD